MSDELRAAAEEAIEMLQDVIDVYEGLEDEHRTDQAKEGYLRAMRERSIHRHYLSASRPDDMEPVTEEWLLSIGFLPNWGAERNDEFAKTVQGWDGDGDDRPHVHIVVNVTDNNAFLEEYDDGGTSNGIVDLGVRSRGQLQRLLSALAGE